MCFQLNDSFVTIRYHPEVLAQYSFRSSRYLSLPLLFGTGLMKLEIELIKFSSSVFCSKASNLRADPDRLCCSNRFA